MPAPARSNLRKLASVHQPLLSGSGTMGQTTTDVNENINLLQVRLERTGLEPSERLLKIESLVHGGSELL